MIPLLPKPFRIFLDSKVVRDDLVHNFIRNGQSEVKLYDLGVEYAYMTLRQFPTLKNNRPECNDNVCIIEREVNVKGKIAYLTITYEKGSILRTLETRQLFKEVAKGVKSLNKQWMYRA